jgi:glycosyltransferase involved in cell wall biosynthesis
MSARIAFLLHEAGPAGGVATVGAVARALEAHGHEVAVVHTGPGATPDELGGVPVRRPDGRSWDLAVATWWETAAFLPELAADRWAVLLQAPELRYYREGELSEAARAAAVLALPAGYLCVSEHLQRIVAAARPDARTWLVRPGVDKAVFGAAVEREGRGPLRVLVEGHPGLWLKGVGEAVAAVRAMREPARLTVVSPAPVDVAGADRVVSRLAPVEMAALFAEHDVLLKLSRFEGLGLVPVEALHAGLPAVVTPYGGAGDWLEDGVNGLEVSWDDPAGTAAVLDGLARDRAALAALGAGALASAAAWPDVEAAGAAAATAVGELLAAPPPPAGPAALAAARQARAWRVLERLDRRRRALERGAAEAALRAELDTGWAEVGAVTGTRAYRAVIGARRALRGRHR